MVKEPARKYNVNPPLNKALVRTQAQKNYFYLERKLYKILRSERATDLLYAWDVAEKKMVTFILSDAKRKMKNAYDTKEVGRLLNRTPVRIHNYISDGIIKPPPKVNEQGRNAFGKPFSKYKWSDEDILALHDYLLTMRGERKDGTIGPATRIPTRRELLALLRNQPMFYMQTANGEFVQVWSAYNEI